MTRLSAIAAIMALSVSGTAQAQFASDSKAPIVIDADTADYRPAYTLLRGQVDVRQAEVRVLADQMKIFTTSGSDNPTDGITRIEADGNFYYITPDQEVKGNRGIYVAANETFTVTGDVVLLQGENVVTGNELVYDLRTDEAKVLGTCQGRKCGSTGRVRILIKQQNTDTPAS